MLLPTPTVGSTNVRGYTLGPTDSHDVSALMSLYGQYPADFNCPLFFYVLGGVVSFPPGTDILFDVVANPGPIVPGSPTALATNLRRA